MNYKEILEENGFSMDWEENSISQYSNKNMLIQILEMENGYHELSACPRSHFDRWANSRLLNWKIMVANYNEVTKFGWTEEMVQEDLKRCINDAIWLVDTLPARMFNSINIDL